MSIAANIGDRVQEGRAFGGLGDAFSSLGDIPKAIEYSDRKDLFIAKKVGDNLTERYVHGNLSETHQDLRVLITAIQLLMKILSLAEEDSVDGNRRRWGYNGVNSGFGILQIFQEVIKSNTKELSVEYQKRCLSNAKEVGDKKAEGDACGMIGCAYDALGNSQQAIRFYIEELSIAKANADRDREGRAYGHLGCANLRLRKYEEAKKKFDQQLSLAEGRSSDACANLGNLYQLLGDYKKAKEYYERSLLIAKEVFDNAGEGRAYSGLGVVNHLEENFQKATEYHTNDISIARQMGNSVQEGRARCNLGNVYVSLGNFQKALECYQSSVNIFDNVRARLHCEDTWKISFRELWRDPYILWWSTSLRLQKIVQALNAAEKGRAQALVDNLKMQYGLTEVSSALLEPESVISDISIKLSTQTVFIGHENNKLNFWIISKGKKVEFRESKIEGRRLNEDSIEELLETTLKESGVSDRVICQDRTLDELIDDNGADHREQSESSQCTSIKSLQPLYDAVIGPIEDVLEGDELIIVPDGPLCLAPFSALSETIRIRTVPSLTTLKLIIDSPADYHSKSGALLVGDPCLEKVTEYTPGTKPKYKKLPHAKQEVEMIGEILRIAALTGTKATKEEVLKRITSVALVHIAAHGQKKTGEIALAPIPGWEKDQDQRSRTWIKETKEEDYILKISDLQDVRLRAQLVVLSCCHSGRGEVKSEGVIGIARAFLAAGARSVLVSLWAISDKATMEFMKIFYQYLFDGKSASVALHQAMKSLRDSKDYCAVKHWAPFVLIGDDVTFDFGVLSVSVTFFAM